MAVSKDPKAVDQDEAPKAKDDKPKLPPQRQRPKMALAEQNIFLLDLVQRCTMHSGDQAGRFAGVAILTLTQDDMLKLETVQQSIAVFDLYHADDLVRREASKRFRK